MLDIQRQSICADLENTTTNPRVPLMASEMTIIESYLLCDKTGWHWATLLPTCKGSLRSLNLK